MNSREKFLATMRFEKTSPSPCMNFVTGQYVLIDLQNLLPKHVCLYMNPWEDLGYKIDIHFGVTSSPATAFWQMW